MLNIKIEPDGFHDDNVIFLLKVFCKEKDIYDLCEVLGRAMDNTGEMRLSDIARTFYWKLKGEIDRAIDKGIL